MSAPTIRWDDEPTPGGITWDDDSPDKSIGETVVGWFRGNASEQAGTVGSDPAFRRQARDQLLRNPSLGGLADLGTFAVADNMFGDDEDIANAAAKLVPGSQVVKDDAGNTMVQTPDGARFYAQKPGIDGMDVRRLGAQVAAYVPAARVASAIGGASLAGRSTLMGLLSGATNVGTQKAAGREEIDPIDVGIATFTGAAGEPVANAVGRIAGFASRLLQRNATKDGAVMALAREAGIADPTPEQLKALASGWDEIKAGADPATVLGNARFGFVYTRGQRAVDPEQRFAQLSREEVLRQHPLAAQPFIQAERTNSSALSGAVQDIGSSFGPSGASPAQNVANAAGRLVQQADDLRGQISTAYQRATELNRAAISRESVTQVPQRMRQALREFDVNATTTPGAARTLEQIQNAARMVASAPEGVKGVTMRALEAQRRIIMNAQGTATNPTDRAALGIIKREFDGWMDDAVENALVSGDPQALTAIKEARGLRAEFGRRFQGGAEADRFIEGLLDGTRTPEELLNVALGAGQVSKASAARFIDRLRVAANNDPEVMGSLKAAHFEKLVRGADGELLDMGRIVSNIRRTEISNASAVSALYSPSEWNQIRMLASSLEPMIKSGEFARSSGTAERTLRMLFQRLLGSGDSLLGNLISSPFDLRAVMQARKAVNAPLPLRSSAPTEASAVVPGVATQRPTRQSP